MPGKKLSVASLVLAGLAARAAAQGPPPCPAPGATNPPLEVIPCNAIGTTIAAGEDDTVNGNAYAACDLPDGYTGKDVVYTFRLYPGNRVGLRLVPRTGTDPLRPDLVLGVLRVQNGSRTCVASSTDRLGSLPEEIAARAFGAGDYLLVVDSFTPGLGGAFTLEVSGANPLPNLAVTSRVIPPPGAAPETVVAGRDFGYQVQVTNGGQLAASAVRLVTRLPAGVTAKLPLPTRCSRAPSEVSCELDTVPVGAPQLRAFTFHLDSAARGDGSGQLSIEARVSSREADSAPGDNRGTARTRVVAEAVLATRVTAALVEAPGGCVTNTPWNQAIAGCELGYRFDVTNRGPSTATNVKLSAPLPPGTDLVSAGPGCGQSSLTALLECTLGTLQPGATPTTRRALVKVRPSATGILRMRPTAKATETAPTLSEPLATPVQVVTDLSVSKESSPNPVTAGRDLTYTFLVTNDGPSDARNVKITDRLPDGLSFVGSSQLSAQSCTCQEPNGGPPCGTDTTTATVTCTVPRVPNRGSDSVAFTSGVRPSVHEGEVLQNQATVEVMEGVDRNPNNNRSNLEPTTVEVRADLDLAIAASPDPVPAGANLVYTLTVINHGPSRSTPGEVQARLEDATFVASPDGCAGGSQAPDEPVTVTCPFGGLGVDQERTLRWVVKASPSLEAGATLTMTATLGARAPEDPRPDNNLAELETDVIREADLAITKIEEPRDPVTPGGPALADPVLVGTAFLYRLKATNQGPSDVGPMTVTDCLPPGFTLLGSEQCASPPLSPGCPAASFACQTLAHSSADDPPTGCEQGRQEVRCAGQGLDVGMCAEVNPCVAPGAGADLGPRVNRARVEADDGTPDPRPDNNRVEEETTVAAASDADLAVTLDDSADPVVPGDSLIYTLGVHNRGPSAASGVAATLCLPEGVSGAQVIAANGGTPASGCEVVVDGGGVPSTCPFDLSMSVSAVVTYSLSPLLPSGEGGEETCLVRAQVPASFTETRLLAQAKVVGDGTTMDPNLGNDQATETTEMLEVAPLVLPFFEVHLGPPTAATGFAVRNRGQGDVRVEYEVLPQETALVCPGPTTETLAPHAVLARNVCQSADQASERVTGAVAITGLDTSGGVLADPGVLSGDFIRLSTGGDASGARLVATTSTRSPRELCQRWELPLVQGGPQGASTDYAFFVPSTAGDLDPVVRGKVFSEAGRFVQELAIPIDAVAFEKNSRELLDTAGFPLLTNSGSIEWELPEGLVGNVSAVYKTATGLAVGVPGACKQPPAAQNLGDEPPLVVPYFEVERGNPNGATVLLAVHNGTEQSAQVKFKYCSSDGVTCSEESSSPPTLPPHATRFVNLRDVAMLPSADLQAGISKGFVTISLPSGTARTQQVLSGAYFRVEAGGQAASGEALVSTDLARSPPELCLNWSTRLLHAGSDLRTEFVFYLNEPAPNPPEEVCGTLYWRNGDELSQPECVPVTARSFALHSAGFDACQPPGGAGGSSPCAGLASIEWLLPVEGHVSAIYRNGSQVVMVPGTCLDQEIP